MLFLHHSVLHVWIPGRAKLAMIMPSLAAFSLGARLPDFSTQVLARLFCKLGYQQGSFGTLCYSQLAAGTLALVASLESGGIAAVGGSLGSGCVDWCRDRALVVMPKDKPHSVGNNLNTHHIPAWN